MTDSFKRQSAKICYAIHHHTFTVHDLALITATKRLVKSDRKSLTKKTNKKKKKTLVTNIGAVFVQRLGCSENLLCTCAGQTSRRCINPGHMWRAARVGFVQVHIYSTGEEGEE